MHADWTCKLHSHHGRMYLHENLRQQQYQEETIISKQLVNVKRKQQIQLK